MLVYHVRTRNSIRWAARKPFLGSQKIHVSPAALTHATRDTYARSLPHNGGHGESNRTRVRPEVLAGKLTLLITFETVALRDTMADATADECFLRYRDTITLTMLGTV
jgi:hypothetical protein